jgi:hypothetical protein
MENQSSGAYRYRYHPFSAYLSMVAMRVGGGISGQAEGALVPPLLLLPYLEGIDKAASR